MPLVRSRRAVRRPATLGAGRLRTAAGCLAVVAALAGCSGSDAAEVQLRVVIPDGNVRPEGAECAGARPYRHIHEGVPFTLETPDGTVLSEGELPVGRAENADPSIDWEDLARIPTVCMMDLTIAGVAEHPDYELHIEGVNPFAFDASHVDEGTPIILIVD